jgi:hypothetical protein
MFKPSIHTNCQTSKNGDIIIKQQESDMKSGSSIKAVPMFIFAFMFMSFAFLAGCKKNDTVITPTTEDPQATNDAAVSLGGSMAINNGGILDQLADLLNTPTDNGVLSKEISSDPNTIASMTKSYDSTTG